MIVFFKSLLVTGTLKFISFERNVFQYIFPESATEPMRFASGYVSEYLKKLKQGILQENERRSGF